MLPNDGPASFVGNATFLEQAHRTDQRTAEVGSGPVGFEHKTREAEAEPASGISVGEHVWVSGLEGEYVVIEVDREKGQLQVLRTGNLSGLERVAADSVRAVLAPKIGEANSTAA